MTQETAHQAPWCTPELFDDPLTGLDRLRETSAVGRIAMPDGTQAWIVTRYEDVRRLLTDPRLSSAHHRPPHREEDGTEPGPDRGNSFRNAMISSDPPVHTRQRRLIGRVLTQRRVEELRPRIEEIADELLSALARRRTADLVSGFTRPLVQLTVCELLGIPHQDRAKAGELMTAVLFRPDPREAAGAGRELQGQIADLVRSERRCRHGDNLLSWLVGIAPQEGDFSDPELAFVATQVLFGAYAPTAHLISGAIFELLRDPRQLAALRDGPRPATVAIEELLRHSGPILPAFRRATEDIDVHGTTIPRSATVLLCLASANRDPAKFPRGGRIDLAGPATRHLAFGRGPHYCPGAQLAVAQGAIALSSLVARFPRLRLAVPADDVPWHPRSFARGITALQVEWDPPR